MTSEREILKFQNVVDESVVEYIIFLFPTNTPSPVALYSQMSTTILPKIAHPGLPLGPSSLYISGPGTHLHAPTSTIYASIVGKPTLTPPTATKDKTSKEKAPNPKNKEADPKDRDPKPTLSIPRLLPSPTHAAIPSANISNTNTLPVVGSVVLARVVRVRRGQIDVVILVVYGDGSEDGEGSVCADEWQAVIRREDIRATEKEKVVCAEGFRVGDVVRGVVISLGDQLNYYLTTGKNELGVIMAKSEAGNTMYPISWKEFKDPETGMVESRKVAKPF